MNLSTFTELPTDIKIISGDNKKEFVLILGMKNVSLLQLWLKLILKFLFSSNC